MGRRPKEGKFVEKHISIPEEVNEEVEILANKEELSFTDCLIKLALQGLQRKTQKYKGFKEVSMSEDWTCFECGKKFKRGRLAMYDQNNGATMCFECAIENELTTKAAARLIIKELRLKRNIKALKDQEKEEAENYLEKFLTRLDKLTTLGLLNKIDDFFKLAKKRHEIWMRYHQEDYHEDGISGKQAFEEFMRMDEEFKQILRDMKDEYQKLIRERQKLLEQKIRQKKRKKQQTYAS